MQGPDSVWKFLTGIFATALITLIIAYPKDTISRTDVDQLKRELAETSTTNRRELEERLIRLEEQVRQLQVDTGRIAERTGVPAQPRH
jgi:hypothetical protein